MHMPMLPYSVAKDNQRHIDVLSNKAIVFVVPGRVKLGVQPNEIRFPFVGEVVDIYITCRVPGATDTMMTVEKISEADFNETSAPEDYVGWVKVSELVLSAGSKTVITAFTLNNTEVQLNDHFRVSVPTLGEGVEDITAQVMIKIIF